MLRRISLVAITLVALAVAVAAPPAGLEAAITGMVRGAGLGGADIGIVVRSLNDDAVWYARMADASFVPASTTKLATTALVLESLGPEYRFSTRILTDGKVADGVLDGNLYVQGQGDPSLVPDDLVAIAQALAAGDPEQGRLPVKKVTGKLIFDDTFFPRPGPLLGQGWEAGDLPWYYAAPSSALSMNRNAVMVTVTGTTPGKRACVSLSPPTALFTVDQHAVTRAGLRTGSAEVVPRGYQVRITGALAPGAEITEKISVPDPVAFWAEQFHAALDAAGIAVAGPDARAATPGDATLLFAHQSAPLAELIVPMLKESDNHFAEQLRWTLLATRKPDVPLDTRYAALLDEFMAYAGVTAKAFRLVDGSGLSRQNAASPEGMAQLLVHLAATPYYDAFYAALPIAGVDGTLKKRMADTAAAGNAHGKTGTMRAICALAGYVTTGDGERLVYAMLVNGYRGGATQARKLQDTLVAFLAQIRQAGDAAGAAPASDDACEAPAAVQ